MEKLINKLRELHQIDIYSVNDGWCVQLFDLDVCPNDYDVQPCPKFQCVFETSGKVLYKVLLEALEWAKERLQTT